MNCFEEDCKETATTTLTHAAAYEVFVSFVCDKHIQKNVDELKNYNKNTIASFGNLGTITISELKLVIEREENA